MKTKVISLVIMIVLLCSCNILERNRVTFYRTNILPISVKIDPKPEITVKKGMKELGLKKKDIKTFDFAVNYIVDLTKNKIIRVEIENETIEPSDKRHELEEYIKQNTKIQYFGKKEYAEQLDSFNIYKGFIVNKKEWKKTYIRKK